MKTFSQLSEELEQYMPVEEAVKKPDPEYHLKQMDHHHEMALAHKMKASKIKESGSATDYYDHSAAALKHRHAADYHELAAKGNSLASNIAKRLAKEAKIATERSSKLD